MKFRFSEEVHKLGVRGVYFNILGCTNRPSRSDIVDSFVSERLLQVPETLEQGSVITGFGDLHKKVSSKPRKLTASSAALLKYFRSKETIPKINGIVDVYNAISVASGIAIGAHDIRHIEGDVTLRLTNGLESYVPLGKTKPEKVVPGEYAYIDDSQDVLCRLEVRQVEKTKIEMGSENIFFIVQAHEAVDPVQIADTASVLTETITSLFGGTLERLYPDLQASML